MIPIEEKKDEVPICPHCKAEIRKLWFREVKTDIMGSKRCLYFCPECKCSLGVSHRKGFFLGF